MSTSSNITPNISKSIIVIVLGDLGRSPRMQNHIISLVQHGFNVFTIAYEDPKTDINSKILEYCGPNSSITNNSNSGTITRYVIPPISVSIPSFSKMWKPQIPLLSHIFQLINLLVYLILFLLFGFLKFLWPMIWLFSFCFLSIGRTDFILVQNPPSLPTLPIVRIISYFHKSKLIIDWHNWGYSILALKLPGGQNNPISSLAKWIEFISGSGADIHLCVSNSMRPTLMKWGVSKPIVLYDRPPRNFRKISSPVTTQSLLSRIPQMAPFVTKQETPLTKLNGSVSELKPINQRPLILVSSTSYTPDEDFGVLLEALQIYDKSNLNLPKLFVFITGKGPLKQYYTSKISKQHMNRIHIFLVWLTLEDYPLLLGSADLGISLHSSSSKVDLPMKIVDMFGCGLPVLGYNENGKYACLSELLTHGHHGYQFHHAKQLAEQLISLCVEYPLCSTLKRFATNVQTDHGQFSSLKWDIEWDSVVSPLLEINPNLEQNTESFE